MTGEIDDAGCWVWGLISVVLFTRSASTHDLNIAPKFFELDRIDSLVAAIRFDFFKMAVAHETSEFFVIFVSLALAIMTIYFWAQRRHKKAILARPGMDGEVSATVSQPDIRSLRVQKFSSSSTPTTASTPTSTSSPTTTSTPTTTEGQDQPEKKESSPTSSQAQPSSSLITRPRVAVVQAEKSSSTTSPSPLLKTVQVVNSTSTKLFLLQNHLVISR